MYKYKCKKEDNIHNEVIRISDNQTKNIKELFGSKNTLSPNESTQNIVFFENYKKTISDNTINEYKQSITGDSALVRKKRRKKHIKNCQIIKGVKN